MKVFFRRGYCIVLITFILISIFTMTVRGESFFEYYFVPESDEASGDFPSGGIEEDYGDFLESLPEDIKNELPPEMFSGDVSKIAEGAEALVGFDYIWEKTIASLESAVSGPLKTLATVFGILILAAVSKALHSSLGGGMGELVHMAVRAGTSLSLITVVSGLIALTEEFAVRICNLMNGTVPLLLAVYATSGNVTTASVQSGGILMLVTLSQNLFSGILLPSVRICIAMSVAGALFPEIGVRAVANLFRNITNWVMVAAVTVFSFALGLQNTIAQSADTFGAKSLKFLVGNMIPIIGSPVAESLSTVGGSLSLVKSAGGGVAVTVILISVLPTVVSLLLHKCVLGLGKGVADGLGCEEEGRLLGDIGSAVSMMCAFSAVIGVAFIYALTLFMTSSLALTA